jgi:hypothetical protein
MLNKGSVLFCKTCIIHFKAEYKSLKSQTDFHYTLNNDIEQNASQPVQSADCSNSKTLNCYAECRGANDGLPFFVLGFALPSACGVTATRRKLSLTWSTPENTRRPSSSSSSPPSTPPGPSLARTRTGTPTTRFSTFG